MVEKEISWPKVECVSPATWTLTVTNVSKKVDSELTHLLHRRWHFTVFAVMLLDDSGRFAPLMSLLPFSLEMSKIASYTVDLLLVVYQEYILTHC